jgi:hypothetical protein
MIVWLASYPRSGNTLLRTVFKQTMGLGSYSDEIMLPSVGHTDKAKQSYGNLTYESSWDSFYHQASSSKDIFLVKTHLPPRDNQPVIYVVRDGRAATESYAAYHKSFAPDPKFCPSILELMLGDDFYGDWSSHYRMWNSRIEGDLLLVRFEELVNADRPLLERLRMFVGFEGEVKLFDNPLQKLNLENPDFFRSGHTVWQGGEQWTEKLKYFFITLHGDLLIQLGYLDATEREAALKKLDRMEVRLLELANKGFSEINSSRIQALTKTCAERLTYINVLEAEVQRLNQVQTSLLNQNQTSLLSTLFRGIKSWGQ